MPYYGGVISTASGAPNAVLPVNGGSVVCATSFRPSHNSLGTLASAENKLIRGTDNLASSFTAPPYNSRSRAADSAVNTGGPSVTANRLIITTCTGSHHAWIAHPRYPMVFWGIDASDEECYFSQAGGVQGFGSFAENEYGRAQIRISKRASKRGGVHWQIGCTSIQNTQKTGSGAFQIFVPAFESDARYVDGWQWTLGSNQVDAWNINLFGTAPPPPATRRNASMF